MALEIVLFTLVGPIQIIDFHLVLLNRVCMSLIALIQ